MLSRQSGNLIVKRHCVAAELNPRDVSAHELRSGISPRGSPGRDAARGHAAAPAPLHPTGGRYCNDADRTKGKAARLAV